MTGTGFRNTAVGSDAGAAIGYGPLTNSTAIGNGALVYLSNTIRLGNDQVTKIEGQVPYTFASDKTKKEKFQSVDADEVLRKIQAMPVSSGNYIGQDSGAYRHYGPMAQDFFAAFGTDGIGTIGTPTTINSGDQAGVLMLAVQALAKRLSDQEARETQLLDTVKQQQSQIQQLMSVLQIFDARDH